MKLPKQLYLYWPSALMGAMSALLIQIIVNLHVLYCTPQLVTVNVQALTQAFVQTMVISQQNDQQKEASISAFAQRLDDVLNDLSLKKHWVIVPSQAVISGATDVTPVIRTLLERHR